ncbi:MAG: hypothetical protein ACAH83_19470 [Alphaproteobacteria bacterium]
MVQEKRIGVRLLIMAIVLVVALAGGCRLGPSSPEEIESFNQERKASSQLSASLKDILVRHGHCSYHESNGRRNNTCGGNNLFSLHYSVTYFIYEVDDPTTLSELKAAVENTFNKYTLVRKMDLVVYKHSKIDRRGRVTSNMFNPVTLRVSLKR